MKTRKPRDARRAELLSAAITLAKRDGYKSVTRQQVADMVGVSAPLVQNYFGTVKNMRRDIIRAAVEAREVKVLAQAVLLDDPLAEKIPDDLIGEVRGCLL